MYANAEVVDLYEVDDIQGFLSKFADPLAGDEEAINRKEYCFFGLLLYFEKYVRKHLLIHLLHDDGILILI